MVGSDSKGLAVIKPGSVHSAESIYQLHLVNWGNEGGK
uniref:Uncharacterized protein n=1 Tax=Anguilla anguilla TaxID=7936 RepID=A0A0E9TZL7_ANGAN